MSTAVEPSGPKEALYDVIAMSLDTRRVRVLACSQSLCVAQQLVVRNVVNQGVDHEMFLKATAGKYRDGDEWSGT